LPLTIFFAAFNNFTIHLEREDLIVDKEWSIPVTNPLLALNLGRKDTFTKKTKKAGRFALGAKWDATNGWKVEYVNGVRMSFLSTDRFCLMDPSTIST